MEETRDFLDDLFDNASSKPKTSFNAANYLNTRLGKDEKEREIRIRIILTPNQNGELKVAIPVTIHSMKVDKQISKSGYKSFICLNDSNIKTSDSKGCPLCNKVSELFDEANKYEKGSAENKSLCRAAYDMKKTKKTAYIVRCIERGKEDEGIKFWRFNKYEDGGDCFDQIVTLARQRNKESIQRGYGKLNIFDYEKGYDLVISLKKGENSREDADGTQRKVEKTKIIITDDKFPSKLSNDDAQAQAWINDTKDWKEMYSAKSFDYLKIIADGDVPYWDSNTNSYIAKPSQHEQDLENEKIKDKILSENIVSNTVQSEQPVPVEKQSVSEINNIPVDGDLPF